MSAIVPLKRAVKSTLAAISHWRVPRVEPVIVRTIPHDRSAFTQGLAYAHGLLYESCGSRRDSCIRCLNSFDGEVRKTVSIANDFGEGIAIHGELLYHLSWKSEKARVFRLPDLELVDELRYQGEGWGLCSGHDGIAMSNGTGTLKFFDLRFHLTRKMRVTLNRLPTRRLNDLEWVRDSIYANVLFSNEILEISAAHGYVTRIIDCSALTAAAGPSDVEHVLNGIAYNPDRNTFFVTGKCWGIMFEVGVPSNRAPAI